MQLSVHYTLHPGGPLSSKINRTINAHAALIIAL